MVFYVPPPLFAGSAADIELVIDSDTYIGDLYVFLGSPTGKKNVLITLDGADAGEISITTDWAIGSTFEFVAINGGRYIGEGGNGGAGGIDLGATGEAGGPGTDGTPAIENLGTYAVSINVDDGFLFGGGGGGGGGSYNDTGTGGDAGGGGGGGQGWSGGAGGAAGINIGLPPATPGTAGTRTAAGAAGSGGGISATTSAGGAGGTWGLGGRTGRSTNMLQGVGFAASFFYYGGLGGDAGEAYKGTNLTLSGATSEADLRTAGRILGEIGTGGGYLTLPSNFNFWGFDIQPTNDNIGISFSQLGYTQEIDTTSSPSASTQYFITGGSGTGANYQVRTRGLSGDSDPSYWDTSAAGAGTWVTVSSLRQYYENFTGGGSAGHLMEMRRSDIPSVGADDVMASFYVKVTMESEP